MKLSTQEEYGLRCLLQLAAGEGKSLTIAELTKLEGISPANVAKIMRVLRRSGFVKSTRGQAGGYALARPADQISVAEVLAALGGRLFDSGFCDRHAGVEVRCHHLGDCSIRPVCGSSRRGRSGPGRADAQEPALQRARSHVERKQNRSALIPDQDQLNAGRESRE